MSSNPFESPTDVEPMLEETPEEDWEDRYGRGSISMFILGGLLGGAITAGVGAVGAGIFAIVGSVILSTDSESLAIAAFGWAFLGALAGAISGAALGAILGVVAATIKARSRRLFSLATIIALALMGGATFGTLGGLMMGGSPSAIGLAATGVLVGTATGIVIGWLLSRVVAGLCWGPPPLRHR